MLSNYIMGTQHNYDRIHVPIFLFPYINDSLCTYTLKLLAHPDIVLGGKAEVLNCSSLVCLTQKLRTKNE